MNLSELEHFNKWKDMQKGYVGEKNTYKRAEFIFINAEIRIFKF